MGWNPKHILLTGASSGIGAELARALAAPGRLMSLSGRNRDRITRVAHTCVELGSLTEIDLFDVRDTHASRAWVQRCFDRKPVDLIIANAGISGVSDGVNDDPITVIDTNIKGVVNIVSAAVPGMITKGSGQIALMSSLAAFRGLPNAYTYGASKAAVRIYGEGLRARLRDHGINVNVICPGFIDTPMTAVNPFAMPLLMNTEQAATAILKGLARNKGLIAFPWQTYLFVRLLAILPALWVDKWFSRVPNKEWKWVINRNQVRRYQPC